MPQNKTVYFLVGPTAVGKTSISIPLAKQLNAEIISADSRQIYKHLDIGTAKPSRDERAEVPHYLVEEIALDTVYTAGQFARDASRIIEEIFSRNRVPLIVGGAGLYIKALIGGLFDESSRDNDVREGLYKRVNHEGIEPLYEEFKQIDPEYAESVHINDTKKIVRAIEIYEVTGKKPSQHFDQEHEGLEYPHQMFILNRERKTLYNRINRRVDQMIENGLVTEVKQILNMGYTGVENALQTVGYQEIIAFLRNKITLEEAVRQIKVHSRHYAKRQLTWFRNQHDGEWFRFEDHPDESVMVESILRIVRG